MVSSGIYAAFLIFIEPFYVSNNHIESTQGVPATKNVQLTLTLVMVLERSFLFM